MANLVRNAPTKRRVAVTKSNTVNINPPNPRYISVNGGGDLAIVDKNGDGEYSPVVVTVAVGILYDMSPLRINDTDTTATGIVAHYGD